MSWNCKIVIGVTCKQPRAAIYDKDKARSFWMTHFIWSFDSIDTCTCHINSVKLINFKFLLNIFTCFHKYTTMSLYEYLVKLMIWYRLWWEWPLILDQTCVITAVLLHGLVGIFLYVQCNTCTSIFVLWYTFY